MLAGATPFARAQTHTLLATAFESHDGETFDIAGPTDYATAPPNARVWLAQGRARTALSPTTRQRLETRTFTDFDGAHKEQVLAVEYGAGKQRLYSLTEDEVRGASQPLRWGLYVEDVSADASQPVQKAFFPFVDVCWAVYPAECDHVNSLHFPGWDPLLDVKLWELPGFDDLLVVLSKKRVLTLLLKQNTSTGAWYFSMRGHATELFQHGRGPNEPYWSTGEQWFHDSSGFIDAYKLAFLTDMTLGFDAGNGRLMAYVLAEMGGYGLGRPYPQAMIACDLGAAGGFYQPTFDADPAPAAVHYRVFNPLFPGVPVGQPASVSQKFDNSALHLDAYALAGPPASSHLYVACGKDKQIHRLDVTSLFPMPSGHQTVFLASSQIAVDANEHLYHVVADAVSPANRFYVSAGTDFFIRDLALAASYTTKHAVGGYFEREPSGLGCLRDAFLMSNLPVGELSKPTLWAAYSDTVDHIGKVVDLSVPPATPGGWVPLVDEYFAIGASDGAVAVVPPGQPHPHVYFPSFGGMAHYLYDSALGRYRFGGNVAATPQSPASYQPSEEPLDSGQVTLTEHTETAFVSTIQGDRHLVFSQPNVGAISQFIVEPGSYDLNPVKRFNPTNSLVNSAIQASLNCSPSCPTSVPNLCWCFDCSPTPFNPNCQGADALYSNDVVDLDMAALFPGATNEYVLTDLTKFDIPDTGATTGTDFQVLLFAYRWDFTATAWEHVAAVGTPAFQTATPPQLSTSITVAKHPSTGILYAFVGFDEGLLAFDIDALPRSGPIGFPALVYKQKIQTGSAVFAVAVVEDRVFFIENGAGSELKLHTYAWDPNDVLVPLTFKAVESIDTKLHPQGLASDSPGGAYRARVRRLSTMTGPYQNHDLFFTGQPYVTRWRWPKGSAPNPDPDRLEITGYWVGDYDQYIQDCRIYDLDLPGVGPKPYILVSKDINAFAIVGPIDVP